MKLSKILKMFTMLRRESSYMMLKVLQCMKRLLMKELKVKKVFEIKCQEKPENIYCIKQRSKSKD